MLVALGVLGGIAGSPPTFGGKNQGVIGSLHQWFPPRSPVTNLLSRQMPLLDKHVAALPSTVPNVYSLFTPFAAYDIQPISGYALLLRHEQAKSNKWNEFGSDDPTIPLTPEGKQRSDLLGDALLNLGIVADTVCLSRTDRTEGTIAPYLKKLQERFPDRRVEVISTNKIIERGYGKLKGRNKDEVRRQYTEAGMFKFHRGLGAMPEGGEDLLTVYNRTKEVLTDVVVPKVGAGKVVILDSHQHPLRTALMYLIQKALGRHLTEEEVSNIKLTNGRPYVARFFKNKGQVQLLSLEEIVLPWM